MTAYRFLTDIADVLRAAGQTVVEIAGWQTRARPPDTGGFEPTGILWHHTGPGVDGTAGSTWMATVGRSDLPPPLVQTSVGRDGTWYVLAAGRANHAGEAKASGPQPAGDGNVIYLGVEVQNSGTEGYSAAQMKAMLIGGAALTRAYGWLADANRGHKETSLEGKWDPGLLDMDAFRRGIADTLAGIGDYTLPAGSALPSYAGEAGYWLPAPIVWDVPAGYGPAVGSLLTFTTTGIRVFWSVTDGSVYFQDGALPAAGATALTLGTPVQIKTADPDAGTGDATWALVQPTRASYNPDGTVLVIFENLTLSG